MATDLIKQEALAPMPPQMSLSPASSHEALATPNSAAPATQTPSPSASSSHNNSASRRPPRKSTLTQQQKNQKRQRATQDQLSTMEAEFNKNPTPTATVRERIAEEINMTERSVQIWFQNRRAKIKKLAKKSLETGEDIDSIPESMRQYLAMQAMESGKSLGGAFFARTGLLPYGHGGMALGEQGGQGKVMIHHLTCRSLNIGKWTRMCQSAMDLIIFYSPDKCTMTYYINNDQAGYKIEYPFSYIKNMFLENPDGDPNKGGGIMIELNHPPNFFMDSSPTTNGFFQCGDFTEDQQASQVLIHHLGGNPKALSGQLAKLVSLEAFMHRHSPHPLEQMQHHHMQQQMHPLAMSAPVSPIPRPSSQPSFGNPHVGMYQQEQWGIAPPPAVRGPPLGHKRQRSRSVPMAVDLSMLQQPMPSFYIQHPGEPQPHPHTPQVYAPIPQQPHSMGPMGPGGLRVDTTAGFGMEMRQYPMSATTVPSPAEFPSSPHYFTSQPPDSTSVAASGYDTPYGGPFLSPMVNPANLGVPPPVSPLPYPGHSEPAIVDQSPPVSVMGRPSSADVYHRHHQHESALSDDGVSLNEMYSKHSINLPMHANSPYTESTPDMDMNQLVHFDSVDPSSLSPESIHHHGP